MLGHKVLGGVAEVDDLLGIEEIGQFQLLLDFLYLIGGQCREEDGIVAVGLTLDDALVVEVFQDFSHIIIYRCTLEEIVYVFLARCHAVVVGNVVEGIEQQHALKHGKVVCTLCLHRQVVGIEAFCHCTKAGSVSLEVLLHIVPEIVGGNGIFVGEDVLIIEEGFHGITSQKLEHASAGGTCLSGEVGGKVGC